MSEDEPTESCPLGSLDVVPLSPTQAWVVDLLDRHHAAAADLARRLAEAEALVVKWEAEDAQTHPEASVKVEGSGYYGSELRRVLLGKPKKEPEP